MRPESIVFELREIASGVAIAASVSDISDSSCRSDLRSVKASQLPPALIPCSRTLLGARPARSSPLGHRGSLVLKSCWAIHGCSAPTSERNWSALLGKGADRS